MDWDGFLMGISDFGLERLKEERQKKTQKELLELQQKYERESAEFKQKLRDKSDRKRVSGTRETADGRIQAYNPFFEDIGESVEQSPWVEEERKMSREGHESQMDYRRRQLDIQEQSLAERRRANELASAAPTEGDGFGIVEDVADMLLSRAGFRPPEGGDAKAMLIWTQARERARMAAERAARMGSPQDAPALFDQLMAQPFAEDAEDRTMLYERTPEGGQTPWLRFR